MSGLDHVDDYPEIPVSLASTRTVLKTGAWRSVRPVLTERSAPCSAACPAGIGIPAYLHDIQAGRLEEAFAALTSRNPFPRITGRVCPHFCEHVCNLEEKQRHEPRFRFGASNGGWATRPRTSPTRPRPTKPAGKLAVVGSGTGRPGGAFYLRRSGHGHGLRPSGSAGGILRYGIPDYRLPAPSSTRKLHRLRAMGIEFRTGIALGVDLTLDDLEASYAAVFVATGAGRERAVGIEGETLLRAGLGLPRRRRSRRALPGEALRRDRRRQHRHGRGPGAAQAGRRGHGPLPANGRRRCRPSARNTNMRLPTGSPSSGSPCPDRS